MVLPVYAYGNTVLREEGEELNPDYPGLQQFIDDMFETMYDSNGVGLAAQQVGKAIKLFIVDASPFAEDEGYEHLADFKKVFINPEIVEEDGYEWAFNEGCLSFPDLRFDVDRNERIRIKYLDRDFKPHDEVYDGISARIIQHEYDHVKGVLFIDRISGLKRKMLTKRLNLITKGMVKASYKMKFPKVKR
jgi:peptide deformylase